MIQAQVLSAGLLTRAGVAQATAAAWVGPLTAATQPRGIAATVPRLAGFLSEILHETGGCTSLAENLNYSATALLAQWPSHFTRADAQRMGRTADHPANQWAIAERVYGGRFGNRPEGSGDGWLFRGHGAIQETFEGNYAELAHDMAWTKPIADLPAYLTTIPGACESAASFWTAHGCNALLDAGRPDQARIVCNGGTIGLQDVLTRYATISRLLAPAGDAGGLAIKDAVVASALASTPGPLSEADALMQKELDGG